MAVKNEVDSLDVFRKNRIIYFNGIFSENEVRELIKKLFEFELKNPKKDIVIFVDTTGGSVDGFLTIHDAINMITSDVATVCIGKAMSAGMLLLMSGKKGKRFMTKNSRVLIHEISSGTIGKLSEMDINIKEVQRMQKVIENIIIDCTNIKSDEIRDFMSKNTYCDAERTKELGIVDYVIESYEDIFGKLNI